MASQPSTPASIPQTLWKQEVPLHITHPSYPNNPFIAALPRFSYLALLLPRLSAYFRTPVSSFHHEDVLLRNLAVGLLVDLYQPSFPWRLTVGDGLSWDIADTFLNCVKEADFIRYGTAKRIMSLSKEDTSALWNSVQDNDYAAFTKINTHLLNAPSALRNIPLRIYIPSSPPPNSASSNPSSPNPSSPPRNAPDAAAGSFRVIQSLVAPQTPNRQPQLLGPALRSLLPTLFPSSRDPVLANVLLHGVPVPFIAPVEELMREAAYPDGWLCLIVILL